MLQNRAVAYINADSAIEGKAILRPGPFDMAQLYTVGSTVCLQVCTL